MRTVIAFALLSAVFAIPVRQETSFLWQDESGVYRLEPLTGTPKGPKADASDVTLYYYTKSNPNVGEVIHLGRKQASVDFDSSKQTIFIIHGWNNNYNSDVNRLVKQAVFSQHDVNVFVVDWSGPANQDYLTAKDAVTGVGIAVGDYINSLISKHGVSASKFNLVGHSLGAHVCGNAGARVNGDVNYIIGMDPAWPLFTEGNTGERLDASDAGYVQVVHTNGGLLGYPNSIGHADFYPNGGSEQAGCGVDPAGTCAHSRAYEYVAESIKSGGFTSTKCASYEAYQSGICNGNHRAAMGGFNVDKSASGDYYLTTNNNSPYSEG